MEILLIEHFYILHFISIIGMYLKLKLTTHLFNSTVISATF